MKYWDIGILVINALFAGFNGQPHAVIGWLVACVYALMYLDDA